MTLRELLVKHGFLAKISQLGCLEMPTKEISLQFFELGMVLSVVHNGSWINMISKLWLTSRTVLIQYWWESYSFKHFERISLSSSKSYCNAIHSWMSWFSLVVLNFSIFFCMPFLIKTIFPKRTICYNLSS